MKIKRLPDWLEFLIYVITIPLELLAMIICFVIGGFMLGFKKCDRCNKWVWLNVDVKERHYGDGSITVCEHCIEKEKLERR